MRDCNHRSVLLNRSNITITSAIYDRRALDCNSEIPLINSLNHLTYLTSNSAKVRETVANDGALVRLVSILNECYISPQKLQDLEAKGGTSVMEKVKRERELAMIAWKWTLAFQCLILTGTRGTEKIRKQVVASGVVPILATVLDNYLLYQKNYDFFKNAPIEFDFATSAAAGSSASSTGTRDPRNVSLAMTSRSPTNILEKAYHLTKPNATSLEMTFEDIWDTVLPEKSVSSAHDSKDIVVSIPRQFVQGKMIPKSDDVIWSLQLLAFISKYTHMKSNLQKVHLVESLSLRGLLDRARQDQSANLDMSPLRISGDETHECLEDVNTQSVNTQDVNAPDANAQKVDPRYSGLVAGDSFTLELLHFCNEVRTTTQNKKTAEMSKDDEDCTPRIVDARNLKRSFQEFWNYNTISKTLDSATWNRILSRRYLNLFPLVERFTVKKESERDMTYWSSVIMRNSCRKNEATGVRQCANFACGKWEDYPKRFAKCRRCKRTKYCSRECQLQSWNYHRYWCQEVGSSSVGASSNGSGTDTPNEGSNSASLADPSNVGRSVTENDRSTLGASAGNLN
ncbi:LAMI_0G04918g1_1 [Lachancea mirantina]|uniref:LAMI_0G04918g1_1 n=1 Tax=Lachancea mirantina TaxID=1230905 RepID=A0A1G4K8T7_9SACH|nr:LAMI_0G04918g1_1 [Lachancea mirantina]